MSEWYYAQGEQQLGPVPITQIQRMIAEKTLNPATDLVWKQGMVDWVPAAQVPELMSTAPVEAAGGGGPSLAPGSHVPMAPMEFEDLADITPGSDPIEVGVCISRGFELTKRHFGIIFLVGLIYVAITGGMGFVIGVIETVIGVNNDPGFTYDPSTGGITPSNDGQSASPGALAVSFLLNVISHVVTLFLSLGVTRIGLDLVMGRPVEVSMIFGQGSKLLRALGASILYGLMVVVGLILLIVPGIYLAIRFGQYQNAIVDRDMGVIESLSYSSDLTTGNRLNLFWLGLLSLLIILAGLLALCIGLIFAYPIVWLAGAVAYRWMQHGRVVLDERGYQNVVGRMD